MIRRWLVVEDVMPFGYRIISHHWTRLGAIWRSLWTPGGTVESAAAVRKINDRIAAWPVQKIVRYGQAIRDYREDRS